LQEHSGYQRGFFPSDSRFPNRRETQVEDRRKPPDRGVMHVETARDVHLRLASTQALDSFLPLVLRELSRPTEPHTAILGALAALASARRDQA
jgi:hypothetical protein